MTSNDARCQELIVISIDYGCDVTPPIRYRCELPAKHDGPHLMHEPVKNQEFRWSIDQSTVPTVLYDMETKQNVHRWAPNMPYQAGDKVIGDDLKVYIRTVSGPSGDMEPCWPDAFGWSKTQ